MKYHMKKEVCLIAQFPPPIHGLSKAVETLYNSELKEEFSFQKIDITNNKRFLKNFIEIFKSTSDLYYFTISQTIGGNFRDLIILSLLLIKKKRCIIHLHGGYYRKLIDCDMRWWQRQINYFLISKLSGVIVLSKSLKIIFENMIDDEKISIVSNCIDNEFLISDCDFEQKVQNINHKKVLSILYLSNFIKSKGYQEVLKLAKLEKERINLGEEKKYHFEFAGKFFEKSDQDYFAKYIKENDLEDIITYHGVVTGEKKRQLLKDCDIFILLTRYPNEGQPISILEAMGNGMVVITTDHAGIPDIVKDSLNGIILEKGEDITSIFTRLENINYPFIMNNNRCVVNQQYSQENYIENLRNVFLKIL